MSGTAVQSESGADFRQKFEDLLAERDEYVQVSRLLAASAYKYVEPADFEGVAPSEYVAHAAKVSDQRAQGREAMFAEMAKERGIDITLSGGGTPVPKQDSSASRIASFGELSGRPVAPPDPTQGLTGRALLSAIYAAEENGKS